MVRKKKEGKDKEKIEVKSGCRRDKGAYYDLLVRDIEKRREKEKKTEKKGTGYR